MLVDGALTDRSLREGAQRLVKVTAAQNGVSKAQLHKMVLVVLLARLQDMWSVWGLHILS